MIKSRDTDEMLRIEEANKKLLEEYRYDLIAGVSLSRIYRKNPVIWQNAIIGTRPEKAFSLLRGEKVPEDIKEYSSFYLEYIRNNIPHTQIRYDRFMLRLLELDISPIAFKYVEDEIRLENFMETYNVDRPTAIKMKSICDNEPIIEPVWERIK